MANVITVDVYRIDNQNLVSALSVGFPAAELFFEETDFVVNGTQMNATIIFSGRRYFVAETVAQLDTLANAGGGGGGVVLQSPDDTLWVLGVNDSGVLQTTQTLSGTAGTLHLFSVDNTEWDVTVTNEGVLVTTAI